MKKLEISHEYSVDLWDEGVCDRKGLEIPWIYACLNPIRQRVERELKLTQTNFQLSPYFLLYFDLEEKCACFADGIITTARQPLSYSSVQRLLENPISLAGDWFSFQRLASKHGLVPFHAMLGTGFHAHKTDVMTLLKNRLLLFANELRKADEADFDSLKSGLMTDVKSVLEEQFGAPPEIFNWNYKDKSGEEHHLEGVSPIEFYREFCGGENEYTVFSDERLPLKIDSVPLPIDDIKHLCARQLENDEQVVICADTSQQANQMLGILDTEFNDNTSVYGVDRYMSKADSFNCKRISPRDFLSLDGVEKKDSAPIRFKAQDSNGALTGADGHYTMNANWFDEYVFYAVINNKLLSE